MRRTPERAPGDERPRPVDGPTEYVPGSDLQRYVAEREPLPEAEAIAMVRDTALGLAHAHQAGVIHRDVKPSNLIRTSTGRVRVLDVGLARLAVVRDHFDHVAPEGLPARKEFRDSSHVYDWYRARS